MARIKVDGVNRNGKSRSLHIRVDEKANGNAFISSPHVFTATTTKLREIADTMHDLADELDKGPR